MIYKVIPSEVPKLKRVLMLSSVPLPPSYPPQPTVNSLKAMIPVPQFLLPLK